MNKNEIAEQIKETEEKLAALRKELEKPEYPTLADSKPGDKLKDGCIVVHKFSDVKMALIAAPESTEIRCPWSKEFNSIFNLLEQQGFNRSQWFIPNARQLELAYNNCHKDFGTLFYWSSNEANCRSISIRSWNVGQVPHPDGRHPAVRAFSLVSY